MSAGARDGQCRWRGRDVPRAYDNYDHHHDSADDDGRADDSGTYHDADDDRSNLDNLGGDNHYRGAHRDDRQGVGGRPASYGRGGQAQLRGLNWGDHCELALRRRRSRPVP